MGKPHKYAWNGIDIETSLSIEQVANMAQRAAQESTGDLLKGKQRVVSTRSGDRQIEFRINDYLISFSKLMVFFLDFEERAGVTFASTRIEWYLTNQQTVGGFIPVSTKRMVAHHTYLQFVRNLGDQVRAAEPSARVRLREGIEMESTGASGVGEELQQVPGTSPSITSTPPPPPPPPPAPAPAPAQHRTPEPPHPPSYSPSIQTAVALPFLPPAAVPPAPAALLGMVTGVPGYTRLPDNPTPPSLSSTVGPTHLDSHVRPDDEDVDATRRAGAGAGVRWEMELPDGRKVQIRETVVVGRNPSPPLDAPTADSVSLVDHTKSVSKTHAMLQVRDGMVWITDLHSTNGTVLTNPTGEIVVSTAGNPMPAGDGWQVGFGDYVVQLKGK